MEAFHLHARRRRMLGAMAVLLLGLSFLGASLFREQVLRTSAYALQSDANRMRPLEVPAPRGAIFDRNGEIVADNVPGYVLSLLPAPRDSVRSMLERLAPILDLGEDRVEQLMSRQRQQPNQPLVVAADLTFEQVSALEERRALVPGVYIETRPKRRYPAGRAIAHLVGYVAEITREELELSEFAGYRPGHAIGRAGIERRYESRLAGSAGLRYVEVDALGRVVGDPRPRPAIASVPGEDLRLHLDLALQRWITEIFPAEGRGAVVALEPATGHVLALYSSPSYDPNDLVGSVDPELWRRLNQDADRPLLHRAVTGLYPPGSVFKLATAAMGLELGVVRPEQTMPIPCRGALRYGNRDFRCWQRQGHGTLDLVEAIQRSCNVYFYQLGIRIGLERFLDEGIRLGFNRRTGIDLPVERTGIFPPDVEWWRQRYRWLPTPTEVLSLSIGQGPNDQTALKMAHFFAALASDGRAPAPRLVAGAPNPDSEALDLSLGEQTLEVLATGLRRVVAPGGTAQLAALEHWRFAGKTGTSENPHGAAHAWFVGWAGPRGGAAPEIVVAVILEQGESGTVAAQYAAKTADYYLRRKHGIPLDTVQTLREHYDAGRPAPWANRD